MLATYATTLTRSLALTDLVGRSLRVSRAQVPGRCTEWAGFNAASYGCPTFYALFAFMWIAFSLTTLIMLYTVYCAISQRRATGSVGVEGVELLCSG